MVSNKWSAKISSPGTPTQCKVPPKPLPPPPPPFPPPTVPLHWIASFTGYSEILSFDESFTLDWTSLYESWYWAGYRAPFSFELGINCPSPYDLYWLTFVASSPDGFHQVNLTSKPVLTPHPHDYHITAFDYDYPGGSTDVADFTF